MEGQRINPEAPDYNLTELQLLPDIFQDTKPTTTFTVSQHLNCMWLIKYHVYQKT